MLDHQITTLEPYRDNLHFIINQHFRLIYVSYEGNKIIYNHDFYLNSIMSHEIIGTVYQNKLILLISYQCDYVQIIHDIMNKFNNKKFTYLVSPEFNHLFDAYKIVALLNERYVYSNQILYVDDTIQLLHNPIQDLYNTTYELLLESNKGEVKIKTLAAYIENNMNVTECAKALYTHRNTVIKRLEKITVEGNIDLNDYLALMNFYIYYCVKQKIK